MSLRFSRAARVVGLVVVVLVAVWTTSRSADEPDVLDRGPAAAEAASEAVGAFTEPTEPSPVPTTTTAPAPPTFHVSADGSDDDGDGSFERPWQTIVAAAGQVPDGAEILVAPGRYDGRVRIERRFEEGLVIRAAEPYRSQLRNDGIVIACHRCAGVTFEGFDVSHSGGSQQYVVQVEDVDGDGVGGRRVTFRNNVFHDSQNNDLMKVNNGADEVLIENNIFYNQQGPDSHIDINSATDVMVRHNVFFNDFPADVADADTASFLVIKDSNGDDDANLGARRITLDGNVFLNWQGNDGNGFISVGEESVDHRHAIDVIIENNLMIGNSPDLMRAAIIARAVDRLTVRHNTITGDLPALAYGLRIDRVGDQPTNRSIIVANNIWSDPTGTMGTEAMEWPNFSDSPDRATVDSRSVGNLFWNGGSDPPEDPDDTFAPNADPTAVVTDPALPDPGGRITVPRLLDDGSGFADGSATIVEAFGRLVATYGTLSDNSPAVDAANPGDGHGSATDILGRPRPSGAADIGAVELD